MSELKKVVAIVDPFSSGAVLSAEILKSGFHCIAVYSEQMDKLESIKNMVPQGLVIKYEAIIDYNVDKKLMLNNIRQSGFDVIAVLAGAETGVELTDELSELMGLRTNGTKQSAARRDKFIMRESVRAAGLRAVKQHQASSWQDAFDFVNEWNPSPFKVILKPINSAGTEDVTLCESMDELKKGFFKILGKKNELGLTNSHVLIQEFLDGPEYVIDMVSRDGVHKVAHIVLYDKRDDNGTHFGEQNIK